MEQTGLKVSLLSYTPIPDEVIAMAARLCYSESTIDDLKTAMDAEKRSAFVKRLVDMGHHSPIEHASFTFGIEGVSRALLAQITRHRLASFSVQSQRYVNKSGGFNYIVPPSIKALGEDAVEKFENQMATMQGWYDEWVEKLGGKSESANQDARFVLPNACETKMIMTMNARELLHFFRLRCCNRAQWEIRALAYEMLKLCYSTCPLLFENAGASCVSGACSEGKMTCKKPDEVRAYTKNYLQKNGRE
ncbi:MAG: FAD-dependent thymidylate synthase [Clostridia bacterium]|nr:FAD-dependent thymidylate synthase [Clostridia bacterium]